MAFCPSNSCEDMLCDNCPRVQVVQIKNSSPLSEAEIAAKTFYGPIENDLISGLVLCFQL